MIPRQNRSSVRKSDENLHGVVESLDIQLALKSKRSIWNSRPKVLKCGWCRWVFVERAVNDLPKWMGLKMEWCGVPPRHLLGVERSGRWALRRHLKKDKLSVPHRPTYRLLINDAIMRLRCL
ncbi:hypothetical protein AVEN_87428-1 [Araneus ventricosus]|uniref:Uncharacterized protein n=1 Tax=Araneus ventricosus TaxID=182803 RepID=A0A4Y2J9S7_ARAVE|nr:hypothetical protein AVEN_87428-1 [Araneus ventricosus]